VEFFATDSTLNSANTTDPYSFGLRRNRFTIMAAPKYQVSYLIDSSNMTTDASIWPFALPRPTVSASVGDIVTDISQPNGDGNTYITVERSDKTVMHYRSCYKVFDLFAYIGGIIYGFFVLLSLLRRFSKAEFEYNFAAECFRA
jgi:hypothetical protein